MKYCKRCGAAAPPTMMLCLKCGAKDFSTQPPIPGGYMNQPSGSGSSRPGGANGELLLTIGAIALLVLLLGLVIYIVYLKQGELAGSSAVDPANSQPELGSEETRLSQAVLNELTDDLGKKIFLETYAEIPFGIYGLTNLKQYEYHPIKKMHVLDLDINWSGQLTGKDYWIWARAYVSDRYIQRGGASGDIHYEVREKSDTVKSLEKTIGGLAIAIGVLNKISERK